MSRSRVVVSGSVFALAALFGCASSTTAGAGAGAATVAPQPAARYGFVVAPMTVVPPTSGASNGFVATALEADGRAGVGADRFGRVEANRVVSERGEDLLRLNADGSIVLPWDAAHTAPQFRLTPEGLDAVNNGRTTHITVDAQGAYFEDGAATGARIAPYDPSRRDTALLLRTLHAIAFMHGMAASNAAPAAPAAPAR